MNQINSTSGTTRFIQSTQSANIEEKNWNCVCCVSIIVWNIQMSLYWFVLFLADFCLYTCTQTSKHTTNVICILTALHSLHYTAPQHKRTTINKSQFLSLYIFKLSSETFKQPFAVLQCVRQWTWQFRSLVQRFCVFCYIQIIFIGFLYKNTLFCT